MIDGFSGRAEGALEAWTRFYSSPGDSWDEAVAVACDSNRNVYVTGYSRAATSSGLVTLAYNSAGEALWTNRCSGEVAKSMAIDHKGNILVAGYALGTFYDYILVKYSNEGQPLWTNYYNGPANGNDEATALAVDHEDNCFVTGCDAQYGLGYAYATIKYSSEGLPLWTNRYDGPLNVDAVPTAVAINKAGNVFVTGNSGTFCLASDGTSLWTNFASINAKALAIDDLGNVIVTGCVEGTGSWDFLTIKYSASGVPLWTNRYDGEASGYDEAIGVTVGREGNVFVTGFAAGNVDPLLPNFNYVTIAYSGTGRPIWTNCVAGTEDWDDFPTAIATNPEGAVIVTGKCFGILGYTYTTVSYSAVGEILWTNEWKANKTGVRSPAGLTVDTKGDVIVTGFVGNGQDYDFATVKYEVLRPVPLEIHLANGRAVMTWTNFNYDLQTGVNVDGPYTNVPFATNPYTNAFSDSKRFFRLLAR